MRKVYLASALALFSIALIGIVLSVQAVGPSPPDEYAVGGEIIPYNPTPYLLSPLLVAAVIVAAIIIASMTIEGFPIRITIERQ
jgi:hypothetical protein